LGEGTYARLKILTCKQATKDFPTNFFKKHVQISKLLAAKKPQLLLFADKLRFVGVAFTTTQASTNNLLLEECMYVLCTPVLVLYIGLWLVP